MSAVETIYGGDSGLSEEERIEQGFILDGDNVQKLFFHHYLHEGDARQRCSDYVGTNDWTRFDGS